MSDYGYVADRARKAFSAAARSEQALARNPQSAAAQLNYASRKKLADQTQEELLRLSELNSVEVCHYRLMPISVNNFPLADVSKSCLNYQYLFSQIHDSIKNGRKNSVSIGREALAASTLQVAYTYAGSLGIVLLAQSEKNFFSGSLDETISTLFEVVSIKNRSDVQKVTDRLGNAVVKRVRDWSAVNSEGGFAVDLRWKRSDGLTFGGVFDQNDFDLIINTIGEVSDDVREPLDVSGTLVGIDLKSETFHISTDDVADIRGSLHEEFVRSESVRVGIKYQFVLVEISKIHYATDVTNVRYELRSLTR